MSLLELMLAAHDHSAHTLLKQAEPEQARQLLEELPATVRGENQLESQSRGNRKIRPRHGHWRPPTLAPKDRVDELVDSLGRAGRPQKKGMAMHLQNAYRSQKCQQVLRQALPLHGAYGCKPSPSALCF